MRIIAGRFRGKALTTPAGVAIRPTADRVREAVFNILVSRLGPNLAGCRVLDLFAGTGALGLEALSRGAGAVVFIDSGVAARGLIRAHIDAFGVAGVARLLRRDATSLGPIDRTAPFDLVFLDPPYGQGLGEKALSSAAAGGWLEGGATVVLEETRDASLDLPPGFTQVDRREYGDTAVHFLAYTPET